ncbi:hypothetical protein JHW43_003984 [Diplocarpon mali]|nr:hypothetical protein JHW43_003984 [Diplocarpon mali]
MRVLCFSRIWDEALSRIGNADDKVLVFEPCWVERVKGSYEVSKHHLQHLLCDKLARLSEIQLVISDIAVISLGSFPRYRLRDKRPPRTQATRTQQHVFGSPRANSEAGDATRRERDPDQSLEMYGSRAPSPKSRLLPRGMYSPVSDS